MTTRRSLSIALTLVVLLGCVAVEPRVGHSQTPRPTTNRQFCLQDLTRPSFLPPIPVGCDSVDCCPGCPAREAIAWRIRLGGDAVASMLLEFEGLPADARAGATLEGDARWVDERRLEIKAGVTFVRGLPREVGGRSPVALPRVGQVRDGVGPVGDAARAFEFSVEQFVGLVRVNEMQARYQIINCRPTAPTSTPDIVRLDNNTSGDNAVVLLTARRDTGCVDNEVLRGTGSIPIGNVLSNSTCRSEVVVFSNHHAVQLLPGVPVWTDAAGDTLSVSLGPPLQTPVVIRVVSPPFTTTSGSGHGDAAQDNVARANDLYGSMNCGIVLQAEIIDATGNPSASGLLTRKCSEAASLRDGIGFTPGKINVYYLADVKREDTPPPGQSDSVRGATCGLVLSSLSRDDWNTILVNALAADAETLAHEIGHAFSLTHTNGNPDIPNTNLMQTSAVGRNSLTEGQCFRVNVNPGSALNANGVRTGPTRSCPDTTTSAECPALSLDVKPSN